MYCSNELSHWGVKGMKWGVRRYQNKDGTLTEAGKKRMYREHFDLEGKDAKEKKKYVADANRWVGEDISRSKGLADSTANLARNMKDLNRSTAKASSKRMDLSSMTDKELRDRINRELLERQYNDVFSPQRESRGREYVDRTLDVAGSVLGVAGSALAVALSIRALIGKG